MIAYLEGSILLVHKDYLVLKTTHGVGYQLSVPNIIQYGVNQALQEFYVYTHVREGEITLYGFASFAERLLFEMLIKTTGVGPKLGVAILTHLPPQELLNTVQLQNTARFNEVPGIGKKTATKLCLDMADLLKKQPIVGLELAAILPPAEGAAMEQTTELVSALTNMGFAERDVLPIIPRLQNEEPQLEQQIKRALALLSSQ